VILLDTNVISEMMRPRPEPLVVSWFDSVAGLPLYISAVTEAELWSGFHLLPIGKRRTVLESLISETLTEDFAGRILPFDSAAARSYGKISGQRSKLGRPINTADCEIAAIAKVHGLKLATRNTSDFEHCDIDLINPWSSIQTD
jgi:toxin FitB